MPRTFGRGKSYPNLAQQKSSSIIEIMLGRDNLRIQAPKKSIEFHLNYLHYTALHQVTYLQYL